MAAALAAGLQPILCVGETEDEREAGETERKLRHQVQEGLEKVESERLADVMIAYEPIWAIGTGKVATPEIAQEAIAFVRALVGDRSKEAAEHDPRALRRQREARQRGRDPRAARRGRRAGRRGEPRPRGLRSHRGGVRRVALVVLDGWGLAEPGPGNAVELADTPVFDELWAEHPHTTLTAWGPAVGLPEGQMGNSEVGHLNLGAGAVVKQDLLRIDEAIEDGSFFENEVLREACRAERVHLLGLVSAGGVHASMDHLEALIELAGARGRRGRGDPRVHRRPRHQPRLGRRLPRRGRRLARRAGGDRDRALLRDGPRQALGPHRARVRRAREGRGRVQRRRARRRPCARPTSAARPTSSSSRRWSARRAASATATA